MFSILIGLLACYVRGIKCLDFSKYWKVFYNVLEKKEEFRQNNMTLGNICTWWEISRDEAQFFVRNLWRQVKFHDPSSQNIIYCFWKKHWRHFTLRRQWSFNIFVSLPWLLGSLEVNLWPTLLVKIFLAYVFID